MHEFFCNKIFFTMSIKLVIFDMDGTLLNTLEDLTDSVNFALNKFGYPLRSISEIKSFIGNGVHKLIERAIPDGLNNSEYSNCLLTFKQYYSNNMFIKTKPYEKITDVLKVLKSQNIKIAVVSNKYDSAVKKLSKRYFEELIDIAIGENERLGIKKKPAPDTVLTIINKFKVSLPEVLYIGDSDTDIQTAKNANINFLGVSWGYKDKEFLLKNGAKKIAESPMEILQFI